MRPRHAPLVLLVLAGLAGMSYSLGDVGALTRAMAPPPPTPEQFFGFRMGTDARLARWDKMVEYFRVVAGATDRMVVREPGKTTLGNPFVVLEIAAPETLKDLDRYKALERKLYYQGGAPTEAERDEIFRTGKAVVLVTCNIHSTEIGATQMAVELVHQLATDQSPRTRKILDNVIFLLVPSLNPDGQMMVVDWYNKNLGTEFAASAMPWLYHPYVGHDNNRDAYMLTQKESQLIARLLWHDWFPAVWLDEHQMGSSGARIFVMPATDPINPNVHPLIYRWNGILGQAQAAALEAAGKDGIIYNATYTNFWQGAMAWSGWWHNQVGLLTEVASVRVASPVEQRRAVPGQTPPAAATPGGGRGGGQNPDEPLAPPRDVTPRTEYPRPWLGGRWTLRDIVDYELIATTALLEACADQREVLLRQIHEVNRATIEAGAKGDPAAILIPVPEDGDPRPAGHLVDKLQQGGVEVWRAEGPFEADGTSYPAGTFVIPMTQVFARYAKDMLERQSYPEVRRAPEAPPEPPYDVTAWSLGMLMGADAVFVRKPLGSAVKLVKLVEAPAFPGAVTGSGPRFVFDYAGADSARAINRLFREGAKLAFESTRPDGHPVTRVHASNIARPPVERIAAEFALKVQAGAGKASAGVPIRAPRVALYQPWTASMDEGWTRWVLEQYEFAPKTLHNADIKAGRLEQQFDVIVFADQQARSVVEGNTARTTRPEYRGGVGPDGLDALRAFVAGGGTLVFLGASTDLAIEQWPIPVRNLKRDLTRDQHFAPGTIVRLEVDQTSPVGYGMPATTYGFYNNSPFFSLVEGFASQSVTVPARYPNTNLVGSGWLKGEELMAGRAAVVTVDLKPGRLVLFGIRPQHRAQTQATFPLLFGALYLSTAGAATPGL